MIGEARKTCISSFGPAFRSDNNLYGKRKNMNTVIKSFVLLSIVIVLLSSFAREAIASKRTGFDDLFFADIDKVVVSTGIIPNVEHSQLPLNKEEIRNEVFKYSQEHLFKNSNVKVVELKEWLSGKRTSEDRHGTLRVKFFISFKAVEDEERLIASISSQLIRNKTGAHPAGVSATNGHAGVSVPVAVYQDKEQFVNELRRSLDQVTEWFIPWLPCESAKGGKYCFIK